MSLMGSEGSLGAERIECPEEVMGEVADSVPVFPYACAIQYRRVRGRTLLPGSEWDGYAGGLYCRVRNGTGCDPAAMAVMPEDRIAGLYIKISIYAEEGLIF